MNLTIKQKQKTNQSLSEMSPEKSNENQIVTCGASAKNIEYKGKQKCPIMPLNSIPIEACGIYLKHAYDAK